MPFSLLSSEPPALTSDQLLEISQATPSTFDGIPPLLRHRELDVHFTITPAFEGYSGSTDGVLSITEGAMSFYNPSTSSGITIPYPLITMHAISRAPISTGPDAPEAGGPCIYCQVDESERYDEDAEEDTSREVIIVPKDPAHLDKIFETLSHCASLHPPPAGADDSIFAGLDPASTVYADADEIETMTEEEEANELSSAGRVRSDFVNKPRKNPY